MYLEEARMLPRDNKPLHGRIVTRSHWHPVSVGLGSSSYCHLFLKSEPDWLILCQVLVPELNRYGQDGKLTSHTLMNKGRPTPVYQGTGTGYREGIALIRGVHNLYAEHLPTAVELVHFLFCYNRQHVEGKV